MSVNPPAWHVDSVRPDDDRKLHEVMKAREQVTGDPQTKSGTIRRAIRRLWIEEVSGNE